ncbi:MAG TPA: VWA domain-containing protein [Natronosporangium sp.]
MTQPSFEIEVHHNEYLPQGGQIVDAIITVSASGAGLPSAADGAVSTAEVIMVDCSGSMGYPITKLTEATRATQTAIDTLREGVPFAVVAGTHNAYLIYPPGGQIRMVPVNQRTRAEAKAAVSRLRADGGTAMSRWLDLANRLFASQPADIKHAILLTDGKNESESPADLDRVLGECEGRFICDSRGIGQGWIAEELMKISSTLLGAADGLEDPAELPAAFRAMTETAMGKAAADVALRIWTPASAKIRFLKQAFPQVEDLTGRRVEVSPRVGDYPTGAWGAESRDYHLSVEVSPAAIGDELLAARVSLVSHDQKLAERLVLAKWTDDVALSTRINPQVAHYTGQEEMAALLRDGVAAMQAGDDATATAKLGRARKIALESGHTDTAKLVERVAEVVDEPTGTIRLKKKEDVDSGIEEIIKVRSVKTTRVKRQVE